MAENIASAIETDEKCAIVCYRQAVGAETENATPIINKELRPDKEWWRRRESNPAPGFSVQNSCATQAVQNPRNSLHGRELEGNPLSCPEQKSNTFEQTPHSSVREKCAIVCQNPTAIAADLAQVIAAWDTLSTPVREAILTIVKNVAPSGR